MIQFLSFYKNIIKYSFKFGSFYGILNGIICSQYELNFENNDNNNVIYNTFIYSKNILFFSFYYGITTVGLILFSPTITFGCILYYNLINNKKD